MPGTSIPPTSATSPTTSAAHHPAAGRSAVAAATVERPAPPRALGLPGPVFENCVAPFLVAAELEALCATSRAARALESVYGRRADAQVLAHPVLRRHMPPIARLAAQLRAEAELQVQVNTAYALLSAAADARAEPALSQDVFPGSGKAGAPVFGPAIPADRDLEQLAGELAALDAKHLAEMEEIMAVRRARGIVDPEHHLLHVLSRALRDLDAGRSHETDYAQVFDAIAAQGKYALRLLRALTSGKPGGVRRELQDYQRRTLYQARARILGLPAAKAKLGAGSCVRFAVHPTGTALPDTVEHRFPGGRTETRQWERFRDKPCEEAFFGRPPGPVMHYVRIVDDGTRFRITEPVPQTAMGAVD